MRASRTAKVWKMTYKAIVEARREAEANEGNLREGIRLGLQLKREVEEKKAKRERTRADHSLVKGGVDGE